MGKVTRARASRMASKSRGLTEIDTATSSPSLPQSGAADGVHCQTLIVPPASGADGLKSKNPGTLANLRPKARVNLLQTDRHAFSTFFYVVAINRVRVNRSL